MTLLRLLPVALLAALSVGGGRMAWNRVRPLPPAQVGDPERGRVAFTDSDLGTTTYASVPRAVWDAIPVLLPDLLPEGWRGVGLIPRPENPDGPPVGWVSRSLMGTEIYTSNCSLCHTGQFDGKVVVGAPNTDLDIQYLVWVLDSAIRSEKLTVDAVAQVAEAKGRTLGTVERQGVRAWILLARDQVSKKPATRFIGKAGAGRSDNLNGFKRIFGLPESHTALVDLVSVFNQKLKTRSLIDGSMTGDHTARVMLSELQKGRSGRDALLNRAIFDDIVAYIEGPLEAPKYPYAIDQALAAKGHAVFSQSCGRCHGAYAPDAPSYPNERVSTRKVGTDPERALAMSPDMVDALENSDYRGLLKIEGDSAYLAPNLGAVWLTAPYLHNGSVPTLWHLLHPEARPVAFYRRWNAFDPKRVGLVCEEHGPKGAVECSPDEKQRTHDPRTLYRLDTKAWGNGNQGHEYGASLPEADKTALLEYLKTL